jgi:hypothetical protein
VLFRSGTPLTVALVVFVFSFLLQTALDFLLPPHSGGTSLLFGTLLRVIMSGFFALIVCVVRRNVARRQQDESYSSH